MIPIKKSTSKKTKLIITSFILICFFSLNMDAQTYPFSFPSRVTAELNVDTSNQEVFKNALLGYNIFGFSSSVDKDFIEGFKPTTIRFPHGLYANWYDWRKDKRRVFGTEEFEYIHRDAVARKVQIGHLASINYFDKSNTRIGIDGLEKINKKRKQKEGNGFDIVWTFNMSADSEFGADTTESPETVARYKDLVARGFEVKDIELGNECFYPNQRSSYIPNAADYIERAKSMSRDLKSMDPNIKVSIPLLRRESWVDPDWNAKLTKDMTYFDAVTVHTYIGSDPDNDKNSDNAYSTALTARQSLETTTNTIALKNHHKFGGNNNPIQKPVWLTEWGVKSGGHNGASALGMADCYLFMSENQHIYHRANWFSVNGKLNSFVAFETYEQYGKTKSRIKYPLEKSAYGFTHQILKDVFENSTMLGSSMLTENLEGEAKAVTARVVTKNGETTVFVLNLTDKLVPFTLKMDNILYEDAFTHKAVQFKNVAEAPTIPFDKNPLTLIKNGVGTILLPALSINTIVLE